MVKFVGLIRLNPGYDPDETWALWQEKHTVWVKRILRPELRHYTVNRVIDTIGESNVYGFSEMLFDDADSCRRAFKRLIENPPDEVLPRFSVDRIILQSVEVPLD